MTSPIPLWVQAEIEALYRAVSSDLFHYARKLLQDDEAAAADLVQETFEAAARYWESRLAPLSGDRKRAWLFKVLRNKAVDQWRAGSRVAESFDDEAINGTRVGTMWAEATEHAALSRLTLDLVWKAMVSLPPMQHRVALLAWQGGWATPEIAAHLGIAQATVRGHLLQARRALERAVGPGMLSFSEADNEDGKGATS